MITFGHPNVSRATSERTRSYDRGTRHTFVGRTIGRIVAALDTRPRTSRFDELDVVFVAQTLAALRVPTTADATARVVLASVVVGVEPAEVARADAARDYRTKMSF